MKMGDIFRPLQNADLISSLPEDILNLVLLRLPIRDAMRTSILSNKWRYAWSKIPVIVFDEECRLSLEESPDSSRLLHIVDKVLLLHSGPTIRTFKLSDFISSYTSDVDSWILFLSRKGVSCIQLNFKKDVKEEKRVASSLCSCDELQELSLHYCKLSISTGFQGFMRLVYLDLTSVSLAEDTTNNLLRLCPRLKTLKLQYDNNISCLEINAPALEYLRINGVFEDLIFGHCSELKVINIYMPNLIYDFQTNKLADTCNLEKILGSLSSIVKLKCYGHFLSFLGLGISRDILPNVFENLKYLVLNLNFQDRKEISTAFCILSSSPNLQYIDIGANWLSFDGNIENTGEEFICCGLHQLRRMNMNFLRGEQPEMEFLKFILANAPVLETVSLTLAEDAKHREGILKSLISFHRASVLLKKFTVE